MARSEFRDKLTQHGVNIFQEMKLEKDGGDQGMI